MTCLALSSSAHQGSSMLGFVLVSEIRKYQALYRSWLPGSGSFQERMTASLPSQTTADLHRVELSPSTNSSNPLHSSQVCSATSRTFLVPRALPIHSGSDRPCLCGGCSVSTRVCHWRRLLSARQVVESPGKTTFDKHLYGLTDNLCINSHCFTVWLLQDSRPLRIGILSLVVLCHSLCTRMVSLQCICIDQMSNIYEHFLLTGAAPSHGGQGAVL